MSLERLRQREVHRYYQSWLESSVGFDYSQPTDKSKYHSDGTRLSITKDTGLMALAQLGCLRLDAKRGLVTLIDSQTQYILAEATKTLSLISHHTTKHRKDELWFGNASIARGQGVSHDALDPPELTAYNEDGSTFTTCALVVNDMTEHPVYKSREYSGRGVSFYCGVPIITPSGYTIGVYTITDDKPRHGISADHLQFMSEMASVVMRHLETSKNEAARFRGEMLTRGLGRFVQGYSALDDTSSQSAPQTSHGVLSSKDEETPKLQTHPELGQKFKGMNITTADPAKLRPINSRSDDSANQSSTSPKLTDHRGEQKESSQANKTLRSSQSDKNASDSTSLASIFALPPGKASTSAQTEGDVHRKPFVRAANILRQCAMADGVLFFDATSDRTLHKPGSHEEPSESLADSGDSGLNIKMPAEETGSGSASGQGENPNSGDTSSSDDDFGHLAGQKSQLCRILGYSLDMSESSSSKSESLAKFELTQQTLSRLIRRYPHGKLFFFDSTGFHSSGDEQSTSVSSRSDNSSQMSGSQRTISAGNSRKTVSQRIARELLRVVPHAQSVLWLPMWDFFQQRWTAGCFLWSRRRERLIGTQDDLVYLRTFANSIMTDVARTEASKVDSAKTTFIANISHELRTPLHGILGSLDVLQDTDLTGLQSSLATAIEVSSKTLADVIDHVLDYAKINQLSKGARKKKPKETALSGQAGISTQGAEVSDGEDFDLAKVTEEVVEAVCASYAFYAKGNCKLHMDTHLHTEAERKSQNDAARKLVDVQVVLDIQQQKTWAVRTHPGAFRRILTNILGNSLKYTERGTIRILLEQKKPVVQDAKFLDLQLTVTDTGLGMSQDFIDHHAFVPFRQGSSFSVGAGLGLSIVKQIVDSYSGEVSMKSQQEVGTEVVIGMAVPVAPPSSAVELVDRLSFDELREKLEGMSMVLLRIEDLEEIEEARVQEFAVFDRAVESVCQNWLGLSTSWASSVEDTKADVYLYTTPPAPDEFIKHQRAEAKTPIAPIIAVTANAVEQAEVLTRSADKIREFDLVFEVICHPVGPWKLARAIAKCLQLTQTSTKERDSKSIGSEKFSTPLRKSLLNRRSNRDQAQSSMLPTESLPQSQMRQPQTAAQGHVTDESGEQRKSPRQPSQPQCGTFSSSKLATSANLKILLVDDNKINISILEQFMRRVQIPYVIAMNGLEALETYQAAHQDEAGQGFSHILMDISMPVMDGITATHKIRQFEQKQKYKASAIIALSGVAEEQTQRDIMNAGADTFLSKPVKFKELIKVIEDNSKGHRENDG